MRTRLLIKPITDIFITEFRVVNNLLEFRTSEEIVSNSQSIAVSIEFGETITVFVTGFVDGWYQTNNYWSGETPNNAIIINQVVYDESDATVDDTLVKGTAFNGTVANLVIDNQGRYIVGGDFLSYNGTSTTRLCRILPNGQIDPTFVTGSGLNSASRSAWVMDDGSYLIGGLFSTYNGASVPGLVWLEEDGSQRSSFVTGSLSGATLPFVYNARPTYDGKILVVGSFDAYAGVTYGGIMRLNPDGSADSSFISGTGFIGSADRGYACLPLANGKAYVAGQFTQYNGTPINRIMRINEDGTLDTTFNVGTGVDFNIINIVPDGLTGAIFICGFFSLYNGISVRGCARIFEDGTLDTSFILPIIAGGVSHISRQANGKYIVSGTFTAYDGIACNGILRINPDTTRDNTFVVGTGFNSSSRGHQLDPQGRIVGFGSFTTWKGVTHNRLIRFSAKRYSVSGNFVDLDLREDLQFPLNFNIADIRNPQTRKSNFSKSIDLPGTDNNSQILSQLFEIDVDSTFNVNRKHEVVVLQDGLDIFNGSLKVNSINRKDLNTVSYDVSLNGELTDIFSKLKNDENKELMLSDLDLLEYDHPITRENILKSWQGIIKKNGLDYVNIESPVSVSVSDTWFAPTGRTVFVIGATASANFKVADVVQFIMDNPGDPTVNFDKSQGTHTIIGFIDAGGNSVEPTDPTCVGPVVNLDFSPGAPNSGTLILKEALGEGYVYPTIYYGLVGEIVNVPELLNIEWVPHIYVKTYLDKIFQSIGLSYESNFFESQKFKRLIMNSYSYFGSVSSWRTDAFNIGSTSGVYDIPFDIVETDVASRWDPINQWYTNGGSDAAINMTFEFNFSGVRDNVGILLNAYRSLNPDGTSNGLWAGGTGSNLDDNGSEMTWSIFSTINGLGQGTTVTGTTGVGPSLRYLLNSQINVSYITLRPGEQIRFKFIFGQGGTPVFATIDNGKFIIETKEVIRNTDMSARDFLLSLIGAFNLYVEPSRFNSNKLIIEPFNEYYSDSFVDWTDKVDISKDITIEPISSITSKTYKFTYDEDSDFYNTQYKNSTGEVYGTHEVTVETEFTDKQSLIKLKYAATPISDEANNGKIIIPAIFKDSLRTPVDSEKPRLFYWTGIRFATDNFFVGGIDTSDVFDLPMFGYAGHLDNPIDATLDINFGINEDLRYYFGTSYAFRLTENTLFNTYYADYIEELTNSNSRLVTMYMKLNSYDITTLSFRKLYWIHGVLYRLQKISDYNPLTGESALCEFIKANTNKSIGYTSP